MKIFESFKHFLFERKILNLRNKAISILKETGDWNKIQHDKDVKKMAKTLDHDLDL